MRLSDLADGRTLLLGFGREGRSLESALLPRFADARVEVVCNRAPDPAPQVWPHYQCDLSEYDSSPDRVLRSPGVPVDHPRLVSWRRAGIPVTCVSSLWFGENPDARVIAVTGSKGKSTTASLIAHLLSATGARVALAGNIGVPLLDLPDRKHDWYVIELSSYQLADLQGHAATGVITRLFPEHQDWHGDIAAYYQAKLRILDLLAGRRIWINQADPELRRALDQYPDVAGINGSADFRADSEGVWRGSKLLVRGAESPLVGRHNLDNLALALAVVDSVAGACEKAVESLAGFRPLPHRLQPVSGPGTGGWINDSISTTPYATLAALEACSVAPVLICGGMERGTQWDQVCEHCAARPLAGLVLLPDNGPEIGRSLLAAGAVSAARLVEVRDMKEAVRQAHFLAAGQAPVLLSPGAPSFPRFRDFEHRGQCFMDAVASLKQDRKQVRP